MTQRTPATRRTQPRPRTPVQTGTGGRLLAGVVVGLMAAILATMVFGLVRGPSASSTKLPLLIFWALGIWMAWRAPSPPKAWRRLLITCSVLAMLLPVAGIVFTGSAVVTTAAQGGAGAVGATTGAVVGGGLLSGLLGIVGFFLGLAFLVVGLLVGRDKQVVHVYVREGREAP